MAKPTDAIVMAFAAARKERDRLRYERAGLLCERVEATNDLDTYEAAASARPAVMHELAGAGNDPGEPCWKAARRWKDNGPYSPTFYFDPPPAEWCDTCQRRQVVSDAYREAVRKHGGALRAVIARGLAIAKAEGR